MKIAVCLPCHGRPTIGFACSLAMLTHFTARERTDIELGVFTTGGSRVHVVRNELIDQGLAWGADSIFMLDCDHSFPEDALLRLLAMNVPVAAINQPTRGDKPTPTAVGMNGFLSFTTEARGKANVIEEVRRMGGHMMLITRQTLERAARPWFAFPESEPELGEDYYFSDKVRAAGFPIHIHHGVSWESGHAHEVTLTNAQTNDQFVTTSRLRA